MSRTYKYLFFLVILMMPALLTACGPLLTPVQAVGEAPPPITQYEAAGTDDPNVFVDLEPFQPALLQAIQSRDEAKLKRLMVDDFVRGWWRGDVGDLPQAEALRELYQDQLGDEIELDIAPISPLSALLSGVDSLGLLGSEANGIDRIVVTGWGKDGKDAAVLFVSRQPDNSLRWAGTLVITGGVQPLVNAQHGYQVYLPLDYEAQQPNLDETVILAPQGTEGHRERAFITVEPANGRAVAQIVSELKATDLADVAGQPGTVMNLDGEMALIFDRVPSQYLMRELFVVHEDRLYRMLFVPQDESAGVAYDQMLNLFAVVVDTFKFIPVENAGPDTTSGGKLVAEPDVFINLLQQGLAERDKAGLQSMMGETFSLALWRSEGIQITPGEAIQQILNNYVPAGAHPVLDPNHAVVAGLFPERPTTDAGEELIPVHVSGWGAEGKDEAVLFIARRADGSLYWQGALTALGGFDR